MSDLKEQVQILTEGFMELRNELQGDYYIAQEPAFCPGMVKDWPNIIPHPTSKAGRLKKGVIMHSEVVKKAVELLR